MIAWIVGASATVWAGDCASAVSPAAGALAVRGVSGHVQIVAGSGEDLQVEGDGCAAGAKVHLGARAGVPTLTAKGDVRLVVRVPPSVGAVTVTQLTGELDVSDVPARVAVVSSEGSVRVRGVDALRVAYLRGDLVTDRVAGDVLVDQLTGSLTAGTVGGELRTDGVTGEVRRVEAPLAAR